MSRIALRLLLVITITLLALGGLRAVHAANQVVSDCGDNGGTNQLRAKIIAANGSGGGTITFTCGPNVTLNGNVLPTITANIVVNGGSTVILSGNNASRIFYVNSGATLTLNDITLTKGYADGDGGAIYSLGTLNIVRSRLLDNHTTLNGNGGALIAFGVLNVTNSEIVNNSAASGGALYPTGAAAVATIIASNLHDNVANLGMYQWGGAIYLSAGATVTITASSLLDNFAREGGAAYVYQTSVPTRLNASDSTFSGNQATSNYGSGGGIRNNAGSVTLNNVTFDSNWQTGFHGFGGGIANGGSITLTNVTLFNNLAYYGGGLYTSGTAALTNVTLSGNFSDATGGGMDNESAATLVNVTFSGNGSNGDISAIGAIGGLTNLGWVSLTNTLLAKGAKGNNCYSLSGGSFNLSDDDSCGFGSGRDGKTLYLGSLTNNGGPTLTQMPQPPSPAIEGGTGGGCPPTDQRGGSRPQGTACDVGAVEVGAKVPFLWLPLIRHQGWGTAGQSWSSNVEALTFGYDRQ